LYNVSEGDVMADPSAQLNQHSDEPGSIGNEAVVAPGSICKPNLRAF
jgi:hypothetical protein